MSFLHHYPVDLQCLCLWVEPFALRSMGRRVSSQGEFQCSCLPFGNECPPLGPPSMTRVSSSGRGRWWDIYLWSAYPVFGTTDENSHSEAGSHLLKGASRADSRRQLTTLLRISEALKMCCLVFLRDSVCLAYLFQLDGSFV